MKTSVYLANRAITAVTGAGSLKVKACCRRDIPWGLVHNGTVQDAEALVPLLAEFWNEHALPRKDVSLVIDSDAVSGRILDVPALSPRRLRDLVRNELAGGQAAGDYVYDYAVIAPRAEGEGRRGRIYGVAAERRLVQAFMDLFGQIGVKLRGIDITQVCAMRFFQRAEEYHGQSFIYTLLCGPDILSILFTDGEYAFIDRGQLMEERGTPAAAVEITRAIQAMAQFNYAQSARSPLSHVYISGLVGEEIQFYGDIADALSLIAGPVAPTGLLGGVLGGKGSPDYGEYLFCLGDLLD